MNRMNRSQVAALQTERAKLLRCLLAKHLKGLATETGARFQFVTGIEWRLVRGASMRLDLINLPA